MANVDTNSGPRKLKPSSADPAKAYEEHAELLYSVCRYFLPDLAASETVEGVAADLFNMLASSGFTRYSRLFCLQAAYVKISADTRAKVPRELSSSEVTIPEAFCLLLRDRFGLSCSEIAATVRSSEGSIRTRLERTRGRLFSADSGPTRHSISDSKTHLCIRTRDQIEDWNISSPRLGQFTTPTAVARAVGDCPRCGSILTQRLSSLSHYHDLHLVTIPDRLRAFPVSPVFVKEGKRVLLNWAAAPWYVKALFEGLLATTLVLGIVLSIPRIKTIYEFWLERRLDLYSIAELAAGLGTSHSDSQSETAGKPAGTASTPAQTGSTTASSGAAASSSAAQSAADAESAEHAAVKSETEFVGREATVPSSDKIYRVLIKTDSPEAIKDQVMQLLSNAHYTAADSDAPPGSELPGGVIFDVFVPFKSYNPLRVELERFGETRFIITRSKERGVAGKAHLKIWLQRI